MATPPDEQRKERVRNKECNKMVSLRCDGVSDILKHILTAKH